MGMALLSGPWRDESSATLVGDALTVGCVRDIPMIGWRRLGIGADITVHRTSEDLVEFYGSPKSYHLFLRWRPSASASPHVHH